ncbi:hypothetical protein CVS40_4678 [Lucilia cuprina]|nr:hypothetical protein CVS40_4678 [Lucilia cuprina]
MAQTETHLPEQLDNEEVREILKNTTDLRQYSRQIEKELRKAYGKYVDEFSKVVLSNISQLSQFIEDMAVSEEMIMSIMETPVTEKEFEEAIEFLFNHKLSLVKELSFKNPNRQQM